MQKQKTYLAIDLKSFYASVECVERGLDPLNTNLVVADSRRTEKTICLAVSPSLKSYGLSGRARLYEVVKKVKEINIYRKFLCKGHSFSGKSYIDSELKKNTSLELDFIIAYPQMAKYMDVSTRIYNIYKKYVSEEDIVVYSIDEVFIDVTQYLHLYKVSAHQLAMKMVLEVLSETGITATAGIGTNLFLAKIAMDIEAKHIKADKNGVRIAELDEMSFRKKLWNHTPITDFWRIGQGYAKKLRAYGMNTMGDVALRSVTNEDCLYKLFGINAELLIDHAWGYEPTEIKDIRAYKPKINSLSSGQVLKTPYTFEKAKLIASEMSELLSLDLVEKGVVTDQLVLSIGYDVENITNHNYNGEIVLDQYGRQVPKSAHGSINLGEFTSSTKILINSIQLLFEKIANKELTVRRISICASHIVSESAVNNVKQLSIFSDLGSNKDKLEREKEKNRQKAVIEIKKKYGKNALLKGMNLQEGATTKERNGLIGGHKA